MGHDVKLICSINKSLFKLRNYTETFVHVVVYDKFDLIKWHIRLGHYEKIGRLVWLEVNYFVCSPRKICLLVSIDL